MNKHIHYNTQHAQLLFQPGKHHNAWGNSGVYNTLLFPFSWSLIRLNLYQQHSNQVSKRALTRACHHLHIQLSLDSLIKDIILSTNKIFNTRHILSFQLYCSYYKWAFINKSMFFFFNQFLEVQLLYLRHPSTEFYCQQ